MELQDATKDENENAPEAFVVENEKVAGKNGEVVTETEENIENEAVESSARDQSKADDKSVETSVDANQDLAALKVPVEENNVENKTVEASSSGMNKPQGLPTKSKVVKTVKKLVKRKVKKGTAVNVTAEQGDKTVVNIKEDEKSAGSLLGKSEKEIKKAIESVAESPQCSSGKDKDSEPSLGGNNMENKNELEESAEAPQPADGVKIVGGEPSGEETLKETEEKAKGVLEGENLDLIVSDKKDAGASPGGNVLEAKKGIESSVQAKTGLVEENKRKRRRRGKQILDSNKKQRNDIVGAGDATQQIVEEAKEQPIDPEKKEVGVQKKEKVGGLIFMCNTKTRPDCFRFSVMGVQEKRKEYVMGIKPGLKLFLYDYDLKLLYGIFQASSKGGMKLERKAFGGAFPAQVRFKVSSDCIPLPESQFKKAIKENYNKQNKFKTELTRKQVFKLIKLFRPAPIPAQVTHTQPDSVPGNRQRSDIDRYAPGSSRTHTTRTQKRRRASPPPPQRREEQPHDLYLNEREYRAYGLRRGQTTQHYPIPPPESSYDIVNHRDRVRLDSYHPSVEHDRLLRQAEIERHDHREVHLLHLRERDYHHMYDHRRREILVRNSPDRPPASAVSLESYRRDPYYNYEFHAPERPPSTYLAPLRREDDDLYSRYITPDSLADYYRSSQRYHP